MYEDGSVITPVMARKEQLLYASTDKYGIYQLKPNPELDSLRFEGTESLKRMGITKDNFDAIKPENYTLLYVGELSELQKETQGATLEAIFENFNLDHPEDFRGHSLSVSDIVVLHQNGQNTAHFVDSFGYTEIPDFLREQTPEKEEMQDTSGHNVQKTEPEIDGDEIIDLGDETEQVLAEMKKTLESEQETELAFSIADRFISIQEVEGGYDYSIMGADYKEIDGGIYDNPDVTIREALHDILEDLKSQPDYNGAKGNIQREDELIPMDYDGLMEKAEEANRIIPESTPSSVVADFRAKTGELFHDNSEMNPEEIEETVKEAMFIAYVENPDCRQIEERHLLESAKQVVPLVQTMCNEIKQLRAKAKDRKARLASLKPNEEAIESEEPIPALILGRNSDIDSDNDIFNQNN